MDFRQSVILDILDKQGSASYEDLAEMLKVSTMTIRRDCERLSKKGEIIKTIGGVQSAHAPSYFYETAVYDRISKNRREKSLIAKAALELIAGHQTIYIDGGTTTLALAKLIAEKCSDITVITNSALTCLEMSQGRNTIIGIGGEYEAPNLCFVGPQAEDFAKSFFVDIAFLSTKGFLPAIGTFESSMATFRVKQIMAQQAAEVALLVDHTKFGLRALSKVLDISQIHHVVTDDKTAPEDILTLEQAGRKVKIATTQKPKETVHVA